MYSVELHDGDWMLDQKHDGSLGAKDRSSWTFRRQLNSDINVCHSVAEVRYCDVQTVHICCVYLPVQFIIHHRRIIFVVSVIILPQSLSALIHLLKKIVTDFLRSRY
jgi:hypothetical protein